MEHSYNPFPPECFGCVCITKELGTNLQRQSDQRNKMVHGLTHIKQNPVNTTGAGFIFQTISQTSKNTKIMEKSFRTNYRTAVEWLGNSYVLCNNITDVDQSIYENARFSLFYYEDEDGNIYDNEDDAPEGVEVYECETDIYQWFITDCSTDQVEYLEEHFGLLFTYSDALDCYILCVSHWGTSWDYVMIDTDLESAARNEGESK